MPALKAPAPRRAHSLHFQCRSDRLKVLGMAEMRADGWSLWNGDGST